MKVLKNVIEYPSVKVYLERNNKSSKSEEMR